MKDTAVYFFLVLIATFFLSGYFLTVHSAKTVSASPVMDITLDNNKISVDLVDAPLVDVLNRIGRDAHFATHLFGDLSDNLTISFSALPMDEGLRRLAGRHSMSFIYHPPSLLSRSAASMTIDEVWVFEGKSSQRQDPSAPDFSPDNQSGKENELVGEKRKSTDGMSKASESEIAITKLEIDELVQQGSPASLMALAAYLGSDDIEVRKMVLNGITSIQGERVIEILGQVMFGEPDPEIRMMAIRAINEQKNSTVVKALLESAVDDPDEGVQALASQLLKTDVDNQ